MDYREYSIAEAFKLQNAGGLVLICIKGGEGRYDLAPIAWSCPIEYEPISGSLVDKYEAFFILYFKAKRIDARLPEGISERLHYMDEGTVFVPGNRL